MIGPEIVEETTEKIKSVRDKMRAAQDRQKHYADKGRKEVEFAVCDMVYLKMITIKGRVRISGRRKLDPRYLGPLRVIERVGSVGYKLDLPSEMEAFHNVFHISQLRKCLTDQDVLIPEIPSDLGTNLTLETRPVRIVDRMEKAMRKKTIQMVKVIWDCNGREETTWETEARMKAEFPKWFDQFVLDETHDSDSRTNPLLVGETCNIPDPE